MCVRGVNATLLLGPPLTYTYYLNGIQHNAAAVSKVAGDINAGASFTLGFTVNIDPNANQGMDRYTLQLSYQSARGLQQINSNLTIDVPIWQGDLHIQTVVTVPTKIYPDSKQVLLQVGIVNSGLGAAKDLLIQLELKPPFTASSSSSDRVYVGNISPGQSAEATFIVDVASDAQFGQYSITLGEQTGGSIIP